MTHEDFIIALQRPTFVWQMARGVVAPWLTAEREDHPLVRSGRIRMARAKAEINLLVLERAQEIQREQNR